MKMLLTVITVLVLSTNRLVVADDQCTKYRFKTPFYPGSSCEDIYNMNPESRDKSGYYWILDGPSYVYCGMNYTGLSCEDIYINNPETGNKNGYYPVNNTQWTFCNITAIAAVADGRIIFSCSGVGGEWRRIASINISAGDDCPTGWSKSLTMALASVEQQVIVLVVTQHSSLLMEQVINMCVGELGDIRRDHQMLLVKMHYQ